MATRTLNVLLTGDATSLKSTFSSATKGAMGAKVGIAAIAAGTAVAAKALYDLGGEFDDAYDKIRVGTGKTGKQLEGLKDDFKNVVANTPADFDEAADAIAGLNQRLGITGKPLRERSKQFLELSRITETDLTGNIKTVTRAFGDWEIGTKKQGKALDYLFRASQRSGAPVEELADNVVKFGAPLRQIGFSFEEATAMFASFEKAGVNTTTMLPGLKMAMKTFFEEDVDPKEGILKTFTGIEKGTVKTSEALKIFGSRAGADMVEAIQQGRFNLQAFTRQLQTGNDTIMRAGEETKDASERFKELGNTLKVKLEPVATAIFTVVGQFAGELSNLDFKSPISGAVAFGLAFAGATVAIIAAQSAIKATFLLMARNPFGALILGAGLAVGALLALNKENHHSVNVYKRAKNTLNGLSQGTQQITRLKNAERKSAEKVKVAEQHLMNVRRRFGPNSREAIEAEAKLAELKNRNRKLTDRLKQQERLHGAQRHAAAIQLREDLTVMTQQRERLKGKEESQLVQLRNLLHNEKLGLPVADLRKKKARELADTQERLNRKTKQIAEVTGQAAREIGDKFVRRLQGALEVVRKGVRQNNDYWKSVRAIKREAQDLPAKKKMDVEVDIHVDGVQTGGGGGGGRRGGGTGDGWGKPINDGIDRKVKKEIQKYAEENPLALMGAGGGGLLGTGTLGPHVPGAWQAFIPMAEHFGLSLSSGFRPGSITSSGNASYHSMNRAGDFSNGVSTPQEYAFGMYLANTFGSVLAELIHTPLGFSIKDGARVAPYAAAEHYDHVHVAYQEGGGFNVPGRGTGDTVPLSIMAEPGEKVFVLNRNASAALTTLGGLNAAFPRFQAGGVVGSMAGVLFRHGFDKEATAGIIGNAYGESNWNPGAVGTGGGGLFGFTTSPVSLEDLKAYAEAKGVPWTNTKMQTQFMLHNGEPTGLEMLGAMNATGSVAEATRVFMDQWERPGIPRLSARIEGAEKAYKMIGGMEAGGGAGGGGGGGSRAPKAHPGRTGKGGGTEGPAGKPRKGEQSPYSPGRTSVPGTPKSKVPAILSGLGKGITSLFSGPDMTREDRFAASELALGMTEDTADKGDDEAVLKYQMGASKARKKAIQKEIARLNKRLGERLTEKQRKQILGKRAELMSELGTVQGRIGSAREGLKSLGESEGEEAEDPLVAAMEKQTEEAEKAREVEEERIRVEQEHIAAIKELDQELELNRHIAESEAGTSAAVARTALADIVSGQLGPRSSHKAQTAGAGTVGTF